ncbi:MAG: pimeloyl-ACP methyl ester carboxylesterase [Alphaproteobacteria bacterium]|jgi:pimeloyl-ACP methyl ester carboxylesterase
MQETHAILARAGQGSIAYHRLEGAQSAAGTAARPGLVFLGGFMSDMTGIKAAWLEEFAADAGLSYLRFDYTGHGHSEGPFTEGTIGSWLQDALDVLDKLTKGPQILIGSSMGGWLALLATLQRPDRVAGLVGVAAAPDFTEDLVLKELSETERGTLMRDGQVTVPSDYGEDPYIITRALIEEARAHLLLKAPITLTCPVHLLHGMKDPDVPWQTALRITEKLESDNVAVTLIKDGDHRLARPQDIARIGAAVLDMISPSPKM